MRTPSVDPLAWHRDALAGMSPPVHEGDVQCGWFLFRPARQWVTDVTGSYYRAYKPIPACIWMDREIDEAGELVTPETLKATVGDQEADPETVWLMVCKRPISETEYHEMMIDKGWSRDAHAWPFDTEV